jgi:excisionase family DNA binding protein
MNIRKLHRLKDKTKYELRRTTERRWITVNECAELLSLHPMSVRKIIARGKIPAVRIGRTVRVDLRALEAQLEEQVKGQAAGWGY